MRYFLLTALIAFIDQVSKKIVNEKIQLNTEVHVNKALTVTHVRNSGAAYGFLNKTPKLLAVLTFLSSFSILRKYYEIYKSGKLDSFYKFSLACISGGAIGNIIDRVRKGYVTDFIRVNVSKRSPIMNVADLFVMLGAIIFSVKQLRDK